MDVKMANIGLTRVRAGCTDNSFVSPIFDVMAHSYIALSMAPPPHSITAVGRLHLVITACSVSIHDPSE